MAEVSGITDRQWDAIVVGTGIGGATLGLDLAQSGWRVLFCEKGRSQSASDRVSGDYPESHFLQWSDEPRRCTLLARAGRSHDTVEDQSAGRSQTFVPFIGSGTGGSSALYGMAMERFWPRDLLPPDPANAQETSLAPWPISYNDLAPYYFRAEQLYGVCGTADPLRSGELHGHLRPPPRSLTPRGEALFQFLEQSGLHPYRLPMACRFVHGCQCCQGYLCPYECKNDSSRICLRPAIETWGAQLLDECEALRLEATRSRVSVVVCRWRGQEVYLRGNIVVLAAGALGSPGLLLASTSPLWPRGLANDSGLVGKNLMRHFTDLYAIFLPGADGDGNNRLKEIAFNDYYYVNDEKLGSVQSFGRLPPAAILGASLQDKLRASGVPWAVTLMKAMRPITTALLHRLVARSLVLATIVEDPPYADNRVKLVAPPCPPNSVKLSISYTIRPYDFARIKAIRALMKGLLQPLRFILIKQAENNQLLAHACGTCRFGFNPHDSVLDRSNRAHGLHNLYVVDSSFFPSSGGTNPALTIAANALRVAASIRARGPQG